MERSSLKKGGEIHYFESEEAKLDDLQQYVIKRYERSIAIDQVYTLLRTRVQILEKEIEELKKSKNLRVLSDEMATQEIRAYLKQKKAIGINEIGILELIDHLRLPIEQIERIMKALESIGVKEI